MEPFADDPPLTDHQLLRELWHRTVRIESQTTKTNGRVTKLERFQYLVIGGLAVVTAVIVPLFIKVVSGG